MGYNFSWDIAVLHSDAPMHQESLSQHRFASPVNFQKIFNLANENQNLILIFVCVADHQ